MGCLSFEESDIDLDTKQKIIDELATAQQANEMCALIRGIVEGILGEELAENLRVQYGGSVKSENIAELMSMPEIDGALVGGASLKPEDFNKIINF